MSPGCGFTITQLNTPSAPGHPMFCFGTAVSFYFSGFHLYFLFLLIHFFTCALIHWYHLLQILSSYLLILLAVWKYSDSNKRKSRKWNGIDMSVRLVFTSAVCPVYCIYISPRITESYASPEYGSFLLICILGVDHNWLICAQQNRPGINLTQEIPFNH